MPFSARYLCCVFLIFGFVVPAQGRTFEEHVNSYCEGVRKPSRQTNTEFTDAILSLSKEKDVLLEPKLLARYPALVYLVVGTNKSSWKRQEMLDDLQRLNANERVELCRVLEMERLQEMARHIGSE